MAHCMVHVKKFAAVFKKLLIVIWKFCFDAVLIKVLEDMHCHCTRNGGTGPTENAGIHTVSYPSITDMIIFRNHD
jgi:hypothetical protein